MPSTVRAATDQRLVKGTTYTYQRMQTKIIKVTAFSGTPISVLYKGREVRSSPTQTILLLKTTRCLDFRVVNQKMKLDSSGKNNHCYISYRFQTKRVKHGVSLSRLHSCLALFAAGDSLRSFAVQTSRNQSRQLHRLRVYRSRCSHLIMKTK